MIIAHTLEQSGDKRTFVKTGVGFTLAMLDKRLAELVIDSINMAYNKGREDVQKAFKDAIGLPSE